jgi:hypothetical protein
MDFDTRVKVALYRRTAEQGMPPPVDAVVREVGAPLDDVRRAYARLAERRLLVLEPDGATIRMAPPFSGVPTPHRVRVEGRDYFANCAWDALGIVAALKRGGDVSSSCAHTGEPLSLAVGRDGPAPSPWLFHCVVPAARWWKDIRFT